MVIEPSHATPEGFWVNNVEGLVINIWKPYRCPEHGDRYSDLVISVNQDGEPHREHVYCGLCFDSALQQLGMKPMERKE